MNSYLEITPEDLKKRLDQGDSLFILDVREAVEYEKANIGGHLIPLSQLASRLDELDPDQEIVVHCHHGGRSAKACEILRENGFEKVMNLTGGIHQWSEQVDSNVARY